VQLGNEGKDRGGTFVAIFDAIGKSKPIRIPQYK
jgi:hypothetical protein